MSTKRALGTVTLIARVVSVQNTDGYAKAGLMVRETLDPGAANAMTFITPSSVADLQSRATSGGLSSYIQGVSATPPYWLKLDRRGDTFNGYGATDGTNWLLLGSVTIPMTNTIYAGLAVTAHNSALLNTATFDHVQLVHPGALVPPALGISRLKGGAIQLTISGPIGVRYSLEASTNLANWLPIATNLNTTGTIQIQPPLSSRVLSKFFRVVVQP